MVILCYNIQQSANTNTYHLYDDIPFIPKQETQVFNHDYQEISSVKFPYTFQNMSHPLHPLPEILRPVRECILYGKRNPLHL